MIGTHKQYQVRFNKELFFEEFGLNISFVANNWQINCSDNVYFTVDDVRKFVTKKLVHGDILAIKYKESRKEFLRVNFLLDFHSAGEKYDLRIDLSSIQKLTIGGTASTDITIADSALGNDSLTLYKQSDIQWSGKDDNTYYGIYVNGQKVDRGQVFTLTNYDFVMMAGYSFFFLSEFLYTDQKKNMQIKLPFQIVEAQESALNYPKFNRGVRLKYLPPEGEIELLPPKSNPKPEDRGLLLSIAQPLAMLLMIVVVRGFVVGGGPMILMSGGMMAIGVTMALVNYRVRAKKTKKEKEDRKTSYEKYIKRKEAEIAEARNEEVKILHSLYRSFDENKATAMAFDNRLFDRDINDEDFMSVRVGTGNRLAQREITYKPQEFQDEEDTLLAIPEILAKRYKNIPNAPVVSEFRTANAVGVIGGSDRLYELFKIMILDIVTRQYYKDVKTIVMFDKQNISKMGWLRWLRHIKNDELGVRNLIYDDESAGTILEYMYSVLSSREGAEDKSEECESESDTLGSSYWYVVFVYDSGFIKEHPIMKYVQSAFSLCFTFVFFESAMELLPKGCNEVVELSDDGESAYLQLTTNSAKKNAFVYIPVPDLEAHRLALRLAPMYVVEASLDNDLTKNITLFELLGIFSVDDLDLATRWENSQVDKSMAAPLGVKMKNEVVALDLHEKYHGPHGLVAGTTGSGKSEIMQSYILSVATLYHPYEVSFVIIDFKGGGMANQFVDLPHLNGAITDVDGSIDGHEIERSLLSIRAELDKRKKFFSDYRVNHIDDYIKLFKKNPSMTPLPHLIILVDEFAELKNEQPDFMKELISAARIGRSLGVHLILATQKPSGVVDPQIWSNSKFKLCLKVQTKEDSKEVLKSPLAAEIVEPGRAYLQVGNNEMFLLFQSAYSGAKVISGGAAKQNTFTIQELNLWGKKTEVFNNKIKGGNDDSKNQLQAVVEFVNEYCKKNSIPRLNSICPPPLQPLIYRDELPETPKELSAGITVTLGQYDDPEFQRQTALVVNISTNNTFIIGSSQTGKTSLLQTVLQDLVSAYLPKEVNIYIVDCGNMSLKVFEKSQLVGGVALPSEVERIDNLFKMLHSEIASRKNIFAQNLVGTFQAYVEAGFKDLPQIFLIIENVTAFREFFTEHDDDIFVLSRDGASVGINLMITGTQTNAITFRMLSNFGLRIALNCNDVNEYSSLFDRCRMRPKATPGRGMIKIEKRVLEFQAGLCVKGKTEKERTESLKKFIEAKNISYGDGKAKSIPIVPDIIKESELFELEPQLFSKPYVIPIGLTYDKIEYKFLNILEQCIFAVSGREKSGKTNFILYLLSILQRMITTAPVVACILDSSSRALEPAKKFGLVKRYSTDEKDSAVILDTVLEQLEKRRSNTELLASSPLLLLIIENPEFITTVSKDNELSAKFAKITKQLKHLKICVIFSNVENVAASFSAPEILKQIKEAKRAMVFEDIKGFKFYEADHKYQRMYPKPLTMGDGFLITGQELEKLKTVFHD